MNISRRLEIIFFGIIALIALFLRSYLLAADPPVDLSFSTGVLTDPAQYTSFARNFALWGSFNPLQDYRFIFFLKSVTTAVSYVVFSILGTGYVQANIVALLFSFPSLLFFYFITRKIAGNKAALIFLALIAFDYNQIFFGRYPLLENSLIFCVSLSFVLLLYTRRLIVSAIAGLILAAGIFFGKMIGLIFIFPAVCFGLYESFYMHRDEVKKYLLRHGFFWIGFISGLIFWYFFSYLPMTSSVEGYLEEQALGLYGAPDGLKSLEFFIYKYASFGATSKFFERIPVPAIVTWFVVAIFFFFALSKYGWKEKLKSWHPGVMLIIAWIIAAYGSLMIWNYRPLRYQTLLIPPIYALCGVALSYLWNNKLKNIRLRIPLQYIPVLFFLLLPLVFQLIAFSREPNINTSVYYKYDDVMFIVAGIIALLLGALGFIKTIKYPVPPRSVLIGLIAVLICLGGGPNIARYINWTKSVSFTSSSAGRDLPQVLSPEAIVSGPYAARLTQDNKIQNLIHMFGVASVDTAFFARYPITHLLLDKPNYDLALKQYPNILNNATLMGEYRITNRLVFLYCIAGLTGNVKADNYYYSDYERARLFRYQGKDDSSLVYLKRFIQNNPENLSGNLLYGTWLFNEGRMNDAGKYFNRAVNFSPTDFHLRFKLGEFYIKMYEITGQDKFFNVAREQFERAQAYNTTSFVLQDRISELLSTKDTLRFE